MVQSANRKQFLIAKEGTYAADACATKLTTATAEIVYQDFQSGAELNNILTPVPIDRARGSASRVKTPPPIPDRCELSAVCALTGRRGADFATPEPPHYSELLEACGFKEVIAGGAATYTPDTRAQGSISCYQYTHDLTTNNARIEWGTGIRCNAVFRFALNTEALFEVTGQGVYGNAIISDAAAFFTPATGALAKLKDGSTNVTARSGAGKEVYADGPILVCSAMTLTAGGEVLCLSELEIDMGWTPEGKPCMGAASTIREVYLTRGEGAGVGGSFNLQDDGDVYDLLRDRFLDAEEIEMVIVLREGDGSPGSARLTITLPKVQIGALTKGTNGNARTHSVPFFANGDWTTLAADNEIEFVFDVVP